MAGGTASGRPLSISLEFFERDVQPVMDEYLLGLCRESDLTKDARAWPNYSRDYRPMVEFCKSKGLRVICANAPRRHVSLAGRGGSEMLSKLPDKCRAFLPPLPIPGPSALYADKFRWTMETMQPGTNGQDDSSIGKPGKGCDADPQDQAQPRSSQSPGRPKSNSHSERSSVECPYIGFSIGASRMLEAQCLWDATMAYSIHEELLSFAHRAASGTGCRPLVMHVCGKFHCEHHLGIPERLREMKLADHEELIERSGATDESECCGRAVKTLVVCIIPSAMQHILKDTLPEAAKNMADYVVLSDAALPRSFDVQHPV